MSEAWGLPKLQKDKDVIVQSRYSINHIDSICGILTCLSCEARQNELTSMAFVLTKLSNEICTATEELEVLLRWAERRREQDEQDKKN